MRAGHPAYPPVVGDLLSRFAGPALPAALKALRLAQFLRCLRRWASGQRWRRAIVAEIVTVVAWTLDP